MKAREFFLMLLIIAAGVTLYHYETGEIENWKLHWRWDWDGPFIRLGKAFTFEETGELHPPFSRALEVVNEYGSVEVLGGPDERMTVTLTKKVWRRKEEDARRAAESLSLIVKDDGRKVIVAAGRPEIGLRNHETHFSLSVPEGMTVTVRNSHGRVRTLRTGETIISNAHGAVEAVGVAGTLTLENRHGDVEAADVAADCSIRNQHAGVNAVRIGGSLKVEHAHGSVTAEDVSGDVTVNAPYSRVTGLRLAGTVTIDCSFNTLSLTDTGAVQAKGRHVIVKLRGVRGDVDVSNIYGRTEVRDIEGRVAISGANTAVRGENLTCPDIDITTSHRGVDLRNFNGRTTVRQKHAAVRLEPASFAGDLRVEAVYSPVDLVWPSSARAPVECRTQNGAIHWKLAAAPSSSTSNGHSLLKAFPEEEGRPAVFLSTTHADITVREKAPEAGTEG